MPTFTKRLLSASTGGRAIPVTITGFNLLTTGNLLHSGVFGTGSFDECYLYASNIYPQDAILTVQWACNNPIVSGDCFQTVIPGQNGRILVADGRIINSGLKIFGLVSGANPAASSGVFIDGYINRIT